MPMNMIFPTRMSNNGLTGRSDDIGTMDLACGRSYRKPVVSWLGRQALLCSHIEIKTCLKSDICSRRSSGMAGTGRTGPRPLHRGARGLDRPIQYGEAQRCARWPHAGRVPLRAGKGRVTVQEIVPSPHSCPFGTASCWGVPAPNPARNECSKLEF